MEENLSSQIQQGDYDLFANLAILKLSVSHAKCVPKEKLICFQVSVQPAIEQPGGDHQHPAQIAIRNNPRTGLQSVHLYASGTGRKLYFPLEILLLSGRSRVYYTTSIQTINHLSPYFLSCRSSTSLFAPANSLPSGRSLTLPPSPPAVRPLPSLVHVRPIKIPSHT